LGGRLPWPHNAKDFKHFRDVTAGSVVVMGRRTYQEIKELKDARKSSSVELLPNRTSVVVSTSLENFTNEEIVVEKSPRAAVECNYVEGRNLFVIGGKTLYTELFPFVKTVYWTIFKEPYPCDTFLPREEMLSDFIITEQREAEELYFLRCERVAGPF
jgi:dihydrofolate reductase